MRRIVFALLLAACGPTASGSDEPPSDIPSAVDPAYVVCKRDADCVAVPASCCNCANGGRATAVNQTSRASWDTHRAPACDFECCGNKKGVDATCAAQPVCVAGTCTLR